MGITRYVLLPTAFAATLLITACGGGGGGGTTAASVTLVPAGQINLALNDGFVSPSGVLGGTEGTGLWDGGGGASDSVGSADAGGAAGDGEFVKVSVKFPGSTGNGSLTWTILRSAYGLEGRTGSMTLQPDSTGSGGYKVVGTGVSANQSNIFVSKSGQITGSLPLPISTGPDSVFAGTRFVDSTATSLATYAGTYTYVSVSAAKGTGANAFTDSGLVYLAANGQGRICPEINNAYAYSPTCAQGLDITASFDSTAKNVLRFVQSPTQATSNATTNNTQLDMIAVAKAFSSTDNPNGMAFSGDFINYNKTDGFRTGAVYASRQGNASGTVTSTFSPASLARPGVPSYWNFSGKDTKTGAGKSVLVMFADVNGTVKRSFIDGNICSNADSVGFSNVPNAPGAVVTVINNPAPQAQTTFGVAQSDADSLVGAAQSAILLGRRTTSAAVAARFTSLNCAPI